MQLIISKFGTIAKRLGLSNNTNVRDAAENYSAVRSCADATTCASTILHIVTVQTQLDIGMMNLTWQ